jgi:hypothetical protein
MDDVIPAGGQPGAVRSERRALEIGRTARAVVEVAICRPDSGSTKTTRPPSSMANCRVPREGHGAEEAADQ